MLINSEPFNRTFLINFNSTSNIYCVPCRLFGNKSVFATIGFSNWKKKKKYHHENLIAHKTCVLKMSQRCFAVGRIDKQIILIVIISRNSKMY